MIKVGIPRSLPCSFGPPKVAITLAIIGSGRSETFAANSGTGQMLLAAQPSFEVPQVLACRIARAADVIGLSALRAWARRRMTGPARDFGFDR